MGNTKVYRLHFLYYLANISQFVITSVLVACWLGMYSSLDMQTWHLAESSYILARCGRFHDDYLQLKVINLIFASHHLSDLMFCCILFFCILYCPVFLVCMLLRIKIIISILPQNKCIIVVLCKRWSSLTSNNAEKVSDNHANKLSHFCHS